MNKNIIVWSYGGGQQTAAIAVLIHQGKLPKPDITVMADTGREAQITWDYLNQVMSSYLAQVGITVEIAPHSLATVDLYSPQGDILIPAYTKNGKLPTFCSVEWKQRPVRRYLRQRGVKQCRMWLGISTDEFQRAKTSNVKWIINEYPLLKMVPMNRIESRRLVMNEGLPEPPRSSCWMCPHRSNREWLALGSQDFGKAQQLEVKMREKDAELWLHKSRQPLLAINCHENAENVDFCDGGGLCWT
jgi:hypothetical protein